MKKRRHKLFRSGLIWFCCVSTALPQAFYFAVPPEKREVRNAWSNRTEPALTPVEREKIVNLKELAPEVAIPQLAWYMLKRSNVESRRLAREVIMSFQDWRNIVAETLDSLSQVKTPPDLLGPHWETSSRAAKISKGIDEASYAGFVARRAQAEIFDMLSLFDNSEAVLLLIPYLFDQSLQFMHSSDQMAGAPQHMVLSVLGTMNLPRKPVFKVIYPSTEEQLRAWREWWLRMAPAFGAESPASINASRAEVALLVAKAHPDESKIKELLATSPSEPVDAAATPAVDGEGDRGRNSRNHQWAWLAAVCLAIAAFIFTFRLWEKVPRRK